MEALDRHSRVALQFSGGKDSLACLYLLQPYWDRLTVYWVNSQAAFPETLRLIDEVRGMVPHFIEIQSNQPADLEAHGLPVDVLPIRNMLYVQPFTGERPRLQPFIECCFKNIMAPMGRKMAEDGITLVIRGQRSDEAHKSPLRSGAVVDGIEYLFPLEGWTSEEVRSYLAERLPANYAAMDTSLDCWSCTAYLQDNIGKRKYMAQHHPHLYSWVKQKLELIAQETERDSRYLRAALEA